MTSESHSRPSAAADNPVASRRDLIAATVTIAAIAGAADAAQAQTGSTVRRFDPPGMTSPPTYNHVVEVNGPHRVVYIAGQTGVDKDGKMAQGFSAQAVQVMENIKIALAAVGGSFENIVKLNSYLVDIAANQPTYRELRSQADAILASSNAPKAPSWRERLMAGPKWDSFAFVDFCEACAEDETTELALAARRIQYAEMSLLV